MVYPSDQYPSDYDQPHPSLLILVRNLFGRHFECLEDVQHPSGLHGLQSNRIDGVECASRLEIRRLLRGGSQWRDQPDPLLVVEYTNARHTGEPSL